MLDDILTIVPIAFALSADCFAVAVSRSIFIGSPSRIQVIRTAASFGSFQAVMAFLGWLAGSQVEKIIGGFDHWLSFALLVFVGSRMIWESIHSNAYVKSSHGHDSTATLLVLSIATSLDALAVGFGLGFLNVNIVLSSTVIGIAAFDITILGFLLGTRLGKLAGKRAEIIGGIILIAIGLRILISHLF